MKYLLYVLLICNCLLQFSCEKFVEVDVPDNKIISKTVFESDETADNAVRGIYNELFKAYFSNGDLRSVSLLSGLSADNLQTTLLHNALNEFENNEILTNNSYNLSLWSSAYQIIYMCNAVVEGLQLHEGVSTGMKDSLSGEAKFIRAFVYFYLVNLYGEVPLIHTSDFRKNAIVQRNGISEIYEAIIKDLKSAIDVLDVTYENDERLRANKFTAMALLSRVYLFLKDWKQAETVSSEVINSSENYMLLNNLDDVFLANSEEAIWQISPAGGGVFSRTNEAYMFIITNPPPVSQTPVALTPNFMAVFTGGDLRSKHWIKGFDSESQRFYFPYKYKKNNDAGDVTEYSMVMRLAEQYLIRAEARAKQAKLTDAIKDLDKIRERANLELISRTAPAISQENLLDSICIERRRELFTEWGHRWLDLKRSGKVNKVLSLGGANWQDTDILYPIPEEEILKNSNLTQNNGY